MDYFTDKNPDIVLHEQPIEQIEEITDERSMR
jgi:hypothetical protein